MRKCSFIQKLYINGNLGKFELTKSNGYWHDWGIKNNTTVAIVETTNGNIKLVDIDLIQFHNPGTPSCQKTSTDFTNLKEIS